MRNVHLFRKMKNKNNNNFKIYSAFKKLLKILTTN